MTIRAKNNSTYKQTDMALGQWLRAYNWSTKKRQRQRLGLVSAFNISKPTLSDTSPLTPHLTKLPKTVSPTRNQALKYVN